MAREAENNTTGYWVYLGTYPFAEGSGGYVRLTDKTGAASPSLDIAADVIRFQHRVAEVSTSQLKGRFFRNPANSGIFRATPADTSVFAQDFPTINFNPPAGSVPCSNATGIGVSSRPFTDVIPQPDGSCVTIPAQGNGYQTGIGELYNFQAVFLGTFTVSGPMRVTFNFYSDDGWILALGPNPAGQKPSFVSGPRITACAGTVHRSADCGSLQPAQCASSEQLGRGLSGRGGLPI